MLKRFINSITVMDVICVAGMVPLAWWLLKTSLGRNALADSSPRRNNMPFYLPFIPLFIWFGLIPMAVSVTRSLLPDLADWQSAFLENLVFCIGAIVTTVVIIFLVRARFARRLKGFGLNVKTIVKDFFAGLVNLLSVWPLVMAMIIVTTFLGKLIWGQDFDLQQHEQLESIAKHSELSMRVLIIVTTVVIGPVLEELLFRGLFQTMIRSFFEVRAVSVFAGADSSLSAIDTTNDESPQSRGAKIRYGAWVSILISSGLFAMVHADLGHWPALFVLALCLGYAYEKSGSLFRPIFIHSLFNATTIMFVLRGA